MAFTAFTEEINNTVRVSTALAYLRVKEYEPDMTALLTILGANEDALKYEDVRRKRHESYLRELEGKA